MTPDTAPEAITQAELRLLIERAEQFALFLNTAPEEHGDTIGADRCVRCLNSHSAGEGLRKVLLDAWPVVSDSTMRGRIASVLRMDDVGYDPAAPVARIHITPEHEEALHRALLASTETVQVFTPPSDAGSTTPSGGEGEIARDEECFGCDGAKFDGYGVVCSICEGTGRRTPSPDASPDSGETMWSPNRAAVEGGDSSDIPVWAHHLGIGGYLDLGWAAFDQRREGKQVATGEWGDQLWLLENGEVACTKYPHGYPSPSPAIVKEAGEVDLPMRMPGHWDTPAGHILAVEYLARTRESLMHGDKSDFVVANGVFLADRHDFELIVWQTAAKERIRWLSARLAALSASNAAQVSK